MKYEYGVEYEANGEKPDLPDDVKIEWYSSKRETWFDRCSFGDISWGDPHYLVVNKFRIVDERYKPKEDESSWHERGELPPVGTHCEVIHGGEFTKCFVVGFDEDGKGLICKVERKEGHVTRVEYIPHYDCTFRPLPTERDKLVDECVKILGDGSIGGHIKTLRDQAKLMVSKDWRPIKQQDEIEFGYTVAKSCKNITVDDAMGLYRAGCRFIERGE